MGYSQTTLTATAGQSGVLSVDWRAGKPVLACITLSSTGSVGVVNLQYTMQDVTSSNVSLGGAVAALPVAPTWLNATALGPFGYNTVSSGVASSAGYPALTFSTSVIDAGGLALVTQAPIAGLRLNSTANTSGTTLTLTVLQGIGW